MCDKLVILNIIRGDLKVLRRLLETETEKDLSLTPQDCADYNKPDIIELLRSAGAFSDDGFHKTLLHVAVATKNIESVKLLVEIGYDVNSYNNRNESVLYFAVAKEFSEIVELLVEKGANINDQRSKESVLSCAVRIHNEPLTKFLLDHGADVNHQNDDGTSPLLYAVKSRSPVITFMILAIADINIYWWILYGIGQEYHNYSSILTLQILEENTIDGESFGGKPYDNIKYLMQREANCSKSRLIKSKALNWALKYGDCRLVKFLVDSGGKMNDCFDGYTALHSAAENLRDADVAKYILDFDIDVNARDLFNFTPLRIAASKGCDQVCKLLLSRGANINLMDIHGNTPLYTAVYNRHFATVKVLLEYGAKLCSKCLSNNVFIRLNEYYDNELINLLIEHVAKLVSLNTWDDEKVPATIKQNNGMKFYYKTCIEELEKMKIWKVYENICLFNILMKRGMASGYARNEDLIKALDNAENQLNHDFPIYYSLLKKDFCKEIEKQKLIKGAAKVLSNIFNFDDRFHFATLEILSYLSKEDLRKIICV